MHVHAGVWVCGGGATNMEQQARSRNRLRLLESRRSCGQLQAGGAEQGCAPSHPPSRTAPQAPHRTTAPWPSSTPTPTWGPALRIRHTGLRHRAKPLARGALHLQVRPPDARAEKGTGAALAGVGVPAVEAGAEAGQGGRAARGPGAAIDVAACADGVGQTVRGASKGIALQLAGATWAT